MPVIDLRMKQEETAPFTGQLFESPRAMSGRTQGALKTASDGKILTLVEAGAVIPPRKTAPDASPVHLTGQLASAKEYYEALCCKSAVLGVALKAKADEASMHGQAFCWADAEQFLWGGTGDRPAGALPEFLFLTSREREKQICLLKVRVIHLLMSHGWTTWGFGGRYDKLISVLSRPGAAQLESLFEQEHFEKFGKRVQDLIIRREAGTFAPGIPWSSVVEDVFGGKAYFESRFDVVDDRKSKQGRELRVVIRDRLYRGGWMQKVEAEGCFTVGSYMGSR